MAVMFAGAKDFYQFIRAWNTDNVVDFTYMFNGADAMTLQYSDTDGYGATPTQDFFRF
jgi:hypothetical protein